MIQFKLRDMKNNVYAVGFCCYTARQIEANWRIPFFANYGKSWGSTTGNQLCNHDNLMLSKPFN